MLIQAHHLTYTKPSNYPNPHFSILMAYFSDEIDTNFESNIPNWPDEYFDGQASIKQTKNYNDFDSLHNCKDCTLIIVVLNKLPASKLQKVNALLNSIKPQHTILLSENNTPQLQNISTYIACKFNLLQALFALAWTVSRMVAEQLVGADYDDFTSYVLAHKHGVMQITNQNTQANDFIGLAAEAINKLAIKPAMAKLIAHIYASTVNQFKGINILFQDYYDIRNLYFSRLDALGICAGQCIVIPCDEQTAMHQAYPYMQIAMFKNAEPAVIKNLTQALI